MALRKNVVGIKHHQGKGTVMAIENPLVIENREELLFLLGEASQLEHMLMCEYLFAVFSLKRDVSEGIAADQLGAINRWDRVISAVAAQEMLHLALASNMLSAIGSSAHFNRPNFPQQSKYFPAGVKVALLPFGKDALLHFLYLERPEGMEREDAAILESRSVQEYFAWPELIPVTDLTSATQAIETIVEEGEGARGDWRQAHYGKFLQVHNEYLALKQQNPDFEPT